MSINDMSEMENAMVMHSSGVVGTIVSFKGNAMPTKQISRRENAKKYKWDMENRKPGAMDFKIDKVDQRSSHALDFVEESFDEKVVQEDTIQSDWISKFPSMHAGMSLCMPNMNLRPRSATSIAMGLRHNTNIESLDISRNIVGDTGATAMAAALSSNTTLETLEMGSNGISSQGVGCLGAALMQNKTLRVLEISFNGMGDEGAILLSKALPLNTGLQHLGLGFNGIMPEGVKAIAKSLPANKTLVSLELSYNLVEDRGASELAIAVGSGCSLQNLGLSSNGITDEGAEALAVALESPNCTLQTLSLASNAMTDRGAMRLAKALYINTCLKALYLEENDFGTAGMDALREAQKATVSLTEMCSERKFAVAMCQHMRLGAASGLSSLSDDVLRTVTRMCQEVEERHVVFYPKDQTIPGAPHPVVPDLSA